MAAEYKGVDYIRFVIGDVRNYNSVADVVKDAVLTAGPNNGTETKAAREYSTAKKDAIGAQHEVELLQAAVREEVLKIVL